jgi:hypothetical protein
MRQTEKFLCSSAEVVSESCDGDTLLYPERGVDFTFESEWGAVDWDKKVNVNAPAGTYIVGSMYEVTFDTEMVEPEPRAYEERTFVAAVVPNDA